MTYHQITSEERYTIAALRREGLRSSISLDAWAATAARYREIERTALALAPKSTLHEGRLRLGGEEADG